MKGYIFKKELEVFSISSNYIKLALFNYNAGKSHSWENMKDPKDRRKVLIKYDTIPETTKRKYGMPETFEDYEYFLIRKTAKENLERKEKEIVVNNEKQKMENSHLFAKIHSILEDGFKNHLHHYRSKLTYSRCKIERIDELSIKYAKIHALYTFYIDYSGPIKTTKGKIKELFEFMQVYKLHYIIPESIHDYIHFSRRIARYKDVIRNGGLLSDELVKDSKFLKIKRVTDEFHKGILMFYASNPKHYSARQLAEFVNFHAVQDNKMKISESWVKNMLNNPHDNTFRTIIESARRGTKYTNDIVLPYLSRHASLYPNNTWFIDGTPIQVYSKDKYGRMQRLYIFVVLDACTRRIIGFDITTTGEDRFMVMNALKMAIRYTGYIPYEIVSDNFSANKTEEIKNVQAELQKFGTKWRFAKVGNAQDKGLVERFNGTFQTVEQSTLEEYIGEGITSRRANGRICPDFLKEVFRKKGLYPSEVMKDFIVGLLCIYNDKKIGGRPSPNEKYKILATDKAIPLDKINIPKLFWKKTEVTVKRGQITLQRNNFQYEYDIWDKSLTLSLQGKKVIVRYDENYHGSVFIYDYHTDELIKEIKLKIKGYASNAEVPEGMEDVNLKFAARKKSLKNYIEDERQRIIDTGLEKIGKTMETFNAISALDLNKHHLNAKESVELMGLYQEDLNRPFNHLNDYVQVAKTGKPVNNDYDKIIKGSNKLSKTL